MKLAIHFVRYGPYHHARLNSARRALEPLGWDVIGLETAGRESTYGWHDQPQTNLFTVFPKENYQEIESSDLREGIIRTLSRLKPDAVAIAGWGFPDARAILHWCRRHGARAILMSETRAADGYRVWWKEWSKAWLVRRFDAALVGGPSHRDYLMSIGFPAHCIHFGYDVIDNDFFASQATKQREYKSNHFPYFLASNRFIARKNLPFLIQAYHQYTVQTPSEQKPWNLCLLGDGPMKPALVDFCHSLGLSTASEPPWENPRHLSPLVFFPGFQPIDKLPEYHARAGCFIHPALQEPWGLVLNEAAACSLPILASHTTGAAEILVEQGVNGWTFDPQDTHALTSLLVRMASPDCPREALGAASYRLLETRAPLEAFGQGLVQCLKPLEANPVKVFWQTQANDYTGNFANLPRGTNFNFRSRLAYACALTQNLSGHLLDCSCGSGEISHALLQSGRFPRATLVDISESMLQHARDRMRHLHPSPDIEWMHDDIFHYLRVSPVEPQFDLIVCLGLIAHTGRLDELFQLWKPRLRPGGRVLLQTTLLDHPGTRLVRAFSSRRYQKRKGYPVHYFRNRDIQQAAAGAGFHVQQCQRFCLGIPYGDRIHPGLNFRLEQSFQAWSTRHGAEALYLLEHQP